MEKMQNEEIYSNFCGVVKDCHNMNRIDLDEKYHKLKSTYPKIYKMAMDSVVNNTVQESMHNLEMFLKTLRDIENNKISKENADMFIGNQLGREYIYPITGDPTKEDYERAVKKIKKDYSKSS